MKIRSMVELRKLGNNRRFVKALLFQGGSSSVFRWAFLLCEELLLQV